MRTEIQMEGKFLDLTTDVEAQITYAIDDIKDFGSKNTPFSKTIEIPGTANNNSLFGNIFNCAVSNDTFSPGANNIGYDYNAGKSAKCLILQDSIQVFKGVLRLLEIKIKNNVITYECAVFGELGGLTSAIGSKLLTGNTLPADDLDFHQYDHVWNATNIVNSWPTAGAGSGYIYPLIDYGAASTLKHDFDVSTFRPALYTKEYVDKIFQGAGYTYDCPFFNRPFFKSLIIPNSSDKMYIKTTQLVYGSKASQPQIVQSSNTGGSAIFSSNLQVDSNVVLNNFTANSFFDTFTNTNSNSLLAFASVNINYVYSGGDKAIRVDFDILRNGSSIGHKSVLLVDSTPGYDSSHTPSAVNGSLSILNNGFTLAPSDVITVKATATIVGSTIVGWRMDLKGFFISIDSNTAVAAPAVYNTRITVNNAIPANITQKDFFSSVLKMFNLYVVEDPQIPKKLIIKPYPEFYNTDSSTFLDWSDRLDYYGDISIKPMSELTARYYNFLYDSDSDYWNTYYKNKYNQNFGDFYYDTSFEFADNKKEVKIIFAGSPVTTFGTEDKYWVPMYKLDNSNVEQQMSTKPRIMQVKRITGVSSWAIKNGSTTLSTQASYCFAGNVDHPKTPTIDLNFGAPAEILYTLINPYPSTNLFNYYYSAYLAEITAKDSKLFTGNFRLSVIDIFNLDFSKLIKLNGSLFRLNRITDYDLGKDQTTRVELLKVVNLFY